MSVPYRLVSLLCLLDAIVLLFFNTYFPLNPDGVQPLWDYVIDPITLSIIVLVVALNVRASIQAHRAQSEIRPLPVDLFLMFTGYVGIVYLHNYVLKFSERFDPRPIIWDLFTPAVIVIMTVSAIIFWRRANKS
jgi:hypothetical protein